MKKFWIVLLSMGLLAAFSIPAFAIDVKFSGEYRVRGWYDSNMSVLEKDKYAVGTHSGASAFYDQRLRIQTDFVVAEGLTLTTRFDALEKKWGDRTGTGNASDSSGRTAAGTKVQENIEFERAYVTFKSPIGLWMVGYQQFMAFGPDPANSSTTRPGIKYILPIGNLALIAAIEKGSESQVGAAIGANEDIDQDIYDVGFVYKLGKMGDLGMMIQYANDMRLRDSPLLGSPRTTFTALDPYVRLNAGPVLIEAEGMYLFGDMDFENPAVKDVDLEEIALFLHARVDLAPVYFGGYFGFAFGDEIDPVTGATGTKREGGMAAALAAGSDFKPCLMLFNDDYATQMGRTGKNAFNGGGVAALGSYMDNIWFYQVYVGVKPTPKLDVKLSGTYAEADEEVIAGQLDKDFGYEVDLTAAYKIYDNLEYMVGGAYFITGDFFKGANVNAKLDDDYMLMHRLTLKF